jgi:hypothetical protein
MLVPRDRVDQRYAHLTKKTPADILARADVKLAS